MSLTASLIQPAAWKPNVVVLRGEHDMATIQELDAMLDAAVRAADADLVVDLREVTFMDASTIGALVRAEVLLRTRARRLQVRRPSWCARRLLDLCGMARLFEPTPGVESDGAPPSVGDRTRGEPHLSPASSVADAEETVLEDVVAPDGAQPTDPDPWDDAVAAFLDDLLDRRGERSVPMPPPTAAPGVDPGVRAGPSGRPRGAVSRIPAELADLPRAAAKALARVTRSADQSQTVYPSIAKALHDVVVAEVLADRLAERVGADADVDAIASLLAQTIDYLGELAATRYEGSPVTHGVVIAAGNRGLRPLSPPVWYPGRLPTRKRTPLLFDGTESVLVVDASGQVLRGLDRSTLPDGGSSAGSAALFEELAGLGGSLTAAAAAAFEGIGFFLRPDRNLWVFEGGTPLFIRRTGAWRSIAIETFVASLRRWGRSDDLTAQRLARAAIRLSVQGKGAVLAIAQDAMTVGPGFDHSLGGDFSGATDPVDDDLSRLIPHDQPLTSGLLARLASIDGATIIDRNGHLLAYGAIVRSDASGGQGARTAAARSLSSRVDVAILVSQDGPITVYVDGSAALDLL